MNFNSLKIFFIILSLAFAFLIILFFLFHLIAAPISKNNQAGLACIKNNCFSVELAKTEAQREKGLMYREKLDKGKGMLFIFGKEGIYPFWMKNTLIPLDIIWIGSNNKISFIKQNASPCSSQGICPAINPAVPVLYVLEVNGGIANELGIKLGDEAKILLQ